ncbi:hypothetical protein Asulf_01175 [Archaeoglobus sulfaticallidus PM70-1]|uniref:Uncharacterized protein n=1 Tax=Archaeoglobus sulfaticallidus PM70-1 TaxID=387631 RepID=N0BC25_9EURY|nr:hypothetical protein [Archaeoglobus sulfaticallidus]AGK61174.1 hypothetical protein Asulf_01175 [Archaeoglobus sulfaticallidus PM70-1]
MELINDLGMEWKALIIINMGKNSMITEFNLLRATNGERKKVKEETRKSNSRVNIIKR